MSTKGVKVLFDYHLHSNFSADCETPMEETIEQAISLGLKAICFTEHIDYEYPDSTIHFELDLQRYDEQINEMKQRYQGQIKIKKGVEIGVQPHILHKYEALMAQESFDFIICSMHTTNKQGLHSGDLFNNRTIEEAYELYYKELLQCIKNYKEYSVLGHLDLVKRYTNEKCTNDFHQLIREIFEVIIPEGKGIEINTSGYRYGINSSMPSSDILKLYKLCGGEIITLGSDSHVASTVADHFKKSLQLLDFLGFKYVATYTNKQPTFHKIQSLL